MILSDQSSLRFVALAKDRGRVANVFTKERLLNNLHSIETEKSVNIFPFFVWPKTCLFGRSGVITIGANKLTINL